MKTKFVDAQFACVAKLRGRVASTEKIGRCSEARLARLRKDPNFVPCSRKNSPADALLFDSDALSELVEFLLHPVPHSGTRRRLFPCGGIPQVRFSRLTALWLLARSATARSAGAWWTCSDTIGACRFVGKYCESTTQESITEPVSILKPGPIPLSTIKASVFYWLRAELCCFVDFTKLAVFA